MTIQQLGFPQWIRQPCLSSPKLFVAKMTSSKAHYFWPRGSIKVHLKDSYQFVSVVGDVQEGYFPSQMYRNRYALLQQLFFCTLIGQILYKKNTFKNGNWIGSIVGDAQIDPMPNRNDHIGPIWHALLQQHLLPWAKTLGVVKTTHCSLCPITIFCN